MIASAHTRVRSHVVVIVVRVKQGEYMISLSSFCHHTGQWNGLRNDVGLTKKFRNNKISAIHIRMFTQSGTLSGSRFRFFFASRLEVIVGLFCRV